MKRAIQGCLVMAVVLLAVAVHAKTASEVFDAVSSSIVVIRTYNTEGKSKGLGSGVVLASDLIATNCHVIEDAAKIRVGHRGKEYSATLRHSDWDRDVCTLTVRGINAPAVKTGSTIRLKVGARVYAIGAPSGLELTLSEGIISSLRPVDGGQYLQITAPISPGSSGGGLFDEEGRLIGLPAFNLAEGQQLNFAVPVEWITELPKRHKKEVEAAQTTTWDGRAVSTSEFSTRGSRCGEVTFTLYISGSKVSGTATGRTSAGTVFEVSGSIDATGAIHLGTATSRNEDFVIFTGVLSGDTGKGIWQEKKGCYGTWTATKKVR
jgi:Trypsin-like peptidase domain